jgi:ArsR family transcriptional regulator, arsenate/arsenite/antimonite-responsive transcriptional repressor
MDYRTLPTIEAAPRRPGQRCCAEDMPAALETGDAMALAGDLELLAHPVRLQLLSVLASATEPVCVCDMESAVPVKQPTVSHHLRLLREAGLVDSEKRGLWAYYHVRRGELDRLRRRIAAGLGRLGGGDE